MARTSLCLAGLLLAWALGAGSAAQAAKRPSSAQAERPAAAVKEPRQRTKAPHRSRRSSTRDSGGSGETTAERERRLLRECRGMPNAGACLGYAS